MSLGNQPELKKAFDKLMAEKAALVEKARPLREKYQALAEQIGPLDREMREVAKEIEKIERPRLAEIDLDLADIARATGGRGVSTW